MPDADARSAARWAAVDAFLEETLHPPPSAADDALAAALEASAAAGLPPHGIAPNQGRLLELLARISGARRVLELGTLGGYSTIFLARAVSPGGVVVSLERSSDYAAVARSNLERAGLMDRVDLRVAPAADTLGDLIAEGVEPFDLVFIDADKQNNPLYLARALELSRPGTVIVADNVVRGGAVADRDDHDPRVTGIRRFLADVAAHPRLSATAIQTVGAKGHDGFLLAVVGE